MRNTIRAIVVVGASLLCVNAAEVAKGGASVRVDVEGQAAGAAAAYTATVKKDEARFTMPVPARDVWRWRVPETREHAREYMLGVKVVNEGQEYSFGFFLWKSPGSTQGAGRFSSLLEAGQKSIFARTSAGRNTIIRDAFVKARQEGGRLVITVSGRKNVARLFSGRPAEVTFQTQLPGEALTSQTVPVVYEN